MGGKTGIGPTLKYDHVKSFFKYNCGIVGLFK